MNPARIAVLVAGLAVLAVNASSVIVVLIVPRSHSSLAVYPMRAVRGVFRRIARLARSYSGMDRILGVSEPVALVSLLATWLVVTVLGFTLVNWGIDHNTLSRAFSEAGSSVFTLGFTLSRNGGSHVVDFIAAGTGLVLVALQIAYLPTLYNAYNRRETLVTLLESRAGSPAWGPELLIRHQLVGLIDNLSSLFAEWERWAADVAESHTSYPSLLYLRSPRAKNSWIISLIAVMDAAALALAVNPEGAPIEARMVIRMGFTCLRDIADTVGIPFVHDPSPDDPIALPEDEFAAATVRLGEIGYPMSRTSDEAWPHFKGWRVNYESVAYALAAALDAPPARWSGPRALFPSESLEPVRPVDRQPSAEPGSGR
ncbi:MAG: hypothetical protein ABSC90_07600 [Acidimicrobiales bacterium]|jgi:hypothetical protein